MILAGHYPTMRFAVADWQKMPVHEKGTWANGGFYRTSDERGKPLVFYAPYFALNAKDKRPHFVVRPIVRVPMAKAA